MKLDYTKSVNVLETACYLVADFSGRDGQYVFWRGERDTDNQFLFDVWQNQANGKWFVRASWHLLWKNDGTAQRAYANSGYCDTLAQAGEKVRISLEQHDGFN